jgi:hypothetical protein
MILFVELQGTEDHVILGLLGGFIRISCCVKASQILAEEKTQLSFANGRIRHLCCQYSVRSSEEEVLVESAARIGIAVCRR